MINKFQEIKLYEITNAAGKLGMCNEDGLVVVDFDYLRFDGWSGNIRFGKLHQSDRLFHAINSKGEILFDTINTSYGFSEELSPTLDANVNKYGFCNLLGNYHIPPIYDWKDKQNVFYSPSGFSEGKTFVLKNGIHSCINSHGEILFELNNCLEVYRFCNNLALVKNEEHSRSFVNENGIAVKLPATNAHSQLGQFPVFGFRNGYCRIMHKGKVNFMDLAGNIIYPDIGFDKASDIHEKIAVISVHGKYGAIDMQGMYVIPPTYAYLGLFNNGIAPYSDGRQYGLVNIEGDIVFEANHTADTVFSKIEEFGRRYSGDPFHEIHTANLTKARVKKRNGKFQKEEDVYINRKGEIVFAYNWNDK